LQAQGIAPAQIAVGGDSAGGGLTAALINHLRAAGEEQPACAWLLSPWTDLTMSGPSLATKDAVDPLIHKDFLEQLVRAYLPKGFDRKDPRVSPLYSSLRGFPPTLVQVGSDETGSADVAVTLEIWPHMIHAWPMWNAHLEAGRLALASAGAFMRRHIATDRARNR
jgi:epsilon-lactone hydrolase